MVLKKWVNPRLYFVYFSSFCISLKFNHLNQRKVLVSTDEPSCTQFIVLHRYSSLFSFISLMLIKSVDVVDGNQTRSPMDDG